MATRVNAGPAPIPAFFSYREDATKKQNHSGHFLICTMPNPGEPGVPCGMFYPDTPEGHQKAEEFARAYDRPGWGVFSSACTFRDPGPETLAWVLEANGWRR
jgi:hypothetical protein